MYITAEKTTCSVEIPDSFLLTPEQEKIVQENYPNIQVNIRDGVLVDVIPVSPPVSPVVTPTPTEKLRADIDYLAALQGVAL